MNPSKAHHDWICADPYPIGSAKTCAKNIVQREFWPKRPMQNKNDAAVDPIQTPLFKERISIILAVTAIAPTTILNSFSAWLSGHVLSMHHHQLTRMTFKRVCKNRQLLAAVNVTETQARTSLQHPINLCLSCQPLLAVARNGTRSFLWHRDRRVQVNSEQGLFH